VASATLQLQRLKDLLADQPKYEDSVQRIDRLADEELAILLELRSVPSEPRQLVLLSRGLIVWDDLREEIDAVVARENAELATARKAAADGERLSTAIIAVSVPLRLLGA
jgi:CHASE3 domain sensor protein